MKTKLFFGILTAFIFSFNSNLFSQAGVLDPNDPDVVFTSTNQPAAPNYNVISKWGHTNRLTWSGQRPFAYGYKSYYFKGMSFRLKFPKTYQHNVVDGKKYPVFIFLHGLGEKGTIWDNEYQLLHGGQRHAEKVNDGSFDGFLLYSQSQNGFHNAYFSKISELIDSLVKYVKADIDRVLISGLSSGGQSTWDFLADYSSDFAAGLPISAAQLEDQQFMPNYVTIPIWTTNGGTDRNPDPGTATVVFDYFKSLGGNLRQTFYPTQGHGVWNSFWNEPDYFSTLNTYHKANPLVYFGRREFCAEDVVSVRMGLQPGFNAYEWQKDGIAISGATSNEYIATAYGTYRARYRRTATGSWSDWSPAPVVVQLKAPTITPPIQVNGLRSIVLPATDGSNTVPLMVPANYVAYEWRRVSDDALVGNANVYEAPPGQYKVKVTELYGCSSSFSDPFTVVDANGANKPDNPSNFTVSVVSNSSLRLDWNDNPNPVHNETGFEIYRSLTAGGPYTLIAITGADILTYLNSGLNPNTNYYYKVRAVNNEGGSAPTPEVGAKTATDTQAPTAPTELRVTGTTRYSVSLDWEPSTDDVGVVKYDVYVNGQKSYSTSETFFTVYNLNQGQTYTFSIRARDFAGNLSPLSNQVNGTAILNGLNYKYYHGSWSNLPDFNTLTPVYTGNTPNIDITQRSQNDNFAFLWEGSIIIPTTGTYYFRTRSDDGSRLWLGPLNGGSSPYSFSGTPIVNNDGLHGAQDRTSAALNLTAGTYPIAIAFFEQGGGESMTVSWRTPSTGTSFITIPNSAFQDAAPVFTPPATPTNFTAVASGYDRITLNWTDNSNNESGFEIWRSTDPNLNFNTVATTGPNATSVIDSMLAPNTTYYYKIRSVGLTGESKLVPANDAQAIWKFNDNYTDASGNGKTLTANNGPTFNTDRQEGSHSVNLDGTDDDLTVNTSSGDYLRGGYSAKTIAFWMRSDVNNSNRGIFDFGGSDDGLAMRLNSNQIIAGIASNNTRRSISASYSSTGWNHIALVYDGTATSLRMYVNGTQVASTTTLPFTSVTTTSDGSMIGDDNGGNALNTSFGQFDGRFDDFWILSSALTDAEVTQLMNSTYVLLVSATTNPLPPVPSAPTNLNAQAVSTSSILIDWDDNSNNETAFEVWRSVNTNTNYRLIATLPANTDNYTDQGLFANVTYFYKVLAKGIGGNSAFTNEASATTPNNLPVIAPIANFAMRFDSQKILNISASDVDGETLSIVAQNVPAFGVFTNTGAGAAQIEFNPLSTDQGVYNIRIIVNDLHGGADTADVVLTVNSNYTPVITPVGNASVNENAQLTIPLTANDQDGNAGLQWQTTGLPAFATLTPGANGAASLLLSPNYAQAGIYPTTLTVIDGDGGIGTYDFTITVNNVETENNKWFVNIQYNQLPGGNAPWNNVNGLSANNLVDQNNLPSSVSLQFLTSAWNSFNGGAVTGNNSGVYPDNVLRDYYYFGIFGAPETVSFRISGLDPAYKYNLTFHAGSSWGGVPDNGSTVFTVGAVSQTLYVQNNTANTVTITSISPDGSGNITVTMSKAPGTPVGYLNAFVLEKYYDDGTAPVLPTNLAAQSNPDGTVKLTWTDIAYNELRYEVYRSTTENGVYTLLNPGEINNNATAYNDNTVNGLTTYFYKIAAANNYGTSGLTNAVTITTINKAPVVNAMSDVFVKTQNSTSVNVVASDDAGETLTTQVLNMPSFVSFAPGTNGNGTININPGANDLGTFSNITVRVTDNFGLTTERKFDIYVSDNATRSIYVNLAGETGTQQAKPWNNLVSYPFGGLTLGNLKDEQDLTTAYSFQLVDPWTSSWYGGMITGNNSGIYHDNVLLSSIYEGTTNAKRLRFTGLNTGKVYNIAVMSSNNAGFDASFTLASGAQSKVFNGRYNSKQVIQLTGLVPNVAGEIEFTMTKAPTASYMYLNAVVLQEYDAPATPLRPVDLFTDINSPGSINLSWSDRSNNETGFEIWRGTSASGSYSLLTTTAANATNYTDNAISSNVRYYYKVRAVNGAINSGYSNTAHSLIGSNRILLNVNYVLPQASPWNNTNNSPLVGAGAAEMKNISDQNTGYSLVVTQDFGGHFDLGMTGGILPDNVMLTSWWVEGNGTPGKMKLYNLDQSKRFRIGFMGSSSWIGDFTAPYTINDRTVYLNSHQNNSRIVYIDDIVPTSDGEIEITMSSLPSTRWSFLSALIIESYEDDSDATPPAEPSSIMGRMVTSAINEEKTGTPVAATTPAPAQRAQPVPGDQIIADGVNVFPNPFDETVFVTISLKEEKQVALRVVDITGREVLRKTLGAMKGSVTVSLNDDVMRKAIPGIYVLQVLADGKQTQSFKLVKRK